MNTYDVGDGVRLKAQFKVGTTLTDPTALTCKVRDPDGTVSEYELGVDNELHHDATGLYHLDYTPTTYGTFYYKFIGTGTAQSVEEKTFYVRKPSIE